MSTAKHTPRAIDLADQLKERYGGIVLTSQAAAELRRLHAMNAALLEALQNLVTLEADGMHAAESAIESWEKARAVISKVTGGAQ